MNSFEERLSRLEEIGEHIKHGKIPLEKSMALFEEGIKLAKSLEKELSKIERKIEILVNQPEKKEVAPQLDLFPELDDRE